MVQVAGVRVQGSGRSIIQAMGHSSSIDFVTLFLSNRLALSSSSNIDNTALSTSVLNSGVALHSCIGVDLFDSTLTGVNPLRAEEGHPPRKRVMI